MNINILNKNFEKIAVIDDFNSLMWCKRYYDVGALDLEITATIENIKIFKKQNYITRNDDDAIYRIEAIELDTDENGDDKLIIGAVDCKAILSQRITWSQVFVRNSTVENFIFEMLQLNIIAPDNNERKITNFITDIPALTTELNTRQSTYDDIGEKIIELCRENELGCKISLNEENKFVFSLYKGVDRSTIQNQNPRIIFSHDFENLYSSKYTFDSTNYKNVALVGGEGEGVDRKTAEIGGAVGLERREMFVDAGSVSSEGGDSVDYRRALVNEGKEKLAEKAVTTLFEGEVDSTSYQYKTDYNLGDIVTVTNKYGISTTVRIVEIIETWDNEGYTVEPVFEYVEEVVNLDQVLLTEELDPVLTENSMPIIVFATHPIVTEDENDYIITENGKNIIFE